MHRQGSRRDLRDRRVDGSGYRPRRLARPPVAAAILRPATPVVSVGLGFVTTARTGWRQRSGLTARIRPEQDVPLIIGHAERPSGDRRQCPRGGMRAGRAVRPSAADTARGVGVRPTLPPPAAWLGCALTPSRDEPGPGRSITAPALWSREVLRQGAMGDRRQTSGDRYVG